ncbi:imidazoleglycerol-phosphate dehydratase HisB [uncultured Victivallis sp.]|uniref:imidazoleglycerol-phosphate dehydratase HisB n=1 Tax=uncultured Victivallis sp. TaxID=354118 RepID=UPI0025E6AD35|nr:imidazoleglycerol-phosphate dehydratase HisB [uncultured Victivallis sp.]
MSTERFAEIRRTTRETDISVKLTLDGTGVAAVDTGIPFMDHMLTLFAKHGFFDLVVKATGDLEVDYHHTMEDLGLTLGEALSRALGDKAGIRRYGSFILPMDEALALIALDLSGRPLLVFDVKSPAPMIKDLDVRLFHEFFQALSVKAGMNLHVRLLAGEEVHHVFEAIFKGFAKALDQAVGFDPRVTGVLSTKGTL